MKMKQIDVTIMGQTYVLGCPPGGDVALLEAVNTVDREMTTIKDAGRVKARERIAVLAALNLAYALAGRALSTEIPLASGAAPGTPVSAQASAQASAQPGDREAPALSSSDGDVIAQLVRRLDHAIGDDDRLL
jgi:cell division protein ZapA